jgi:phosphoesterase RecJ-like protein
MGSVLKTMEYLDDGRICFMHLTNAMLEGAGAEPSETEGLIDYALHTRGVALGALFKEVNSGETRVSLRSRSGVDVATLAARWGGGGHVRAAGCTMPRGLEQAKTEFFSYLKESGTIADN